LPPGAGGIQIKQGRDIQQRHKNTINMEKYSILWIDRGRFDDVTWVNNLKKALMGFLGGLRLIFSWFFFKSWE